MKFLSLTPILMRLGMQSPPSSQKSLYITLTPRFESNAAVEVDVQMRFPAPESSVTASLLFSVDEIAEIPGLQIKNGSLEAMDDYGVLRLIAHPDTSVPQISSSSWIPTRRPRGNIQISYTALPRQVTNATRSGPAMDFRAQDDGLLGAGYGLLCVPFDFESTYDVRLHWDLSLGPIGTQTAWTFGDELDAERNMSPIGLLSTYLATGPLQKFDHECSNADENFNIYWLGQPPFDACDIGKSIQSIFHALADFFSDQNEPYRVFLRHNPYPGTNTGTALDRSFMFSYDDSDYSQTGDNIFRVMVLSHEMVHNWVRFSEDRETTTSNWYAEGLAEYYSLFFLFRNGIISEKVLLRELNRRLHAYYTSPLVGASNEEAAKYTWSSTAAQRLPYRRGLVFAIILNEIIWKGSKERYLLDDAVLDVLKSVQLGLSVGPEEFIKRVTSLANDEDGILDTLYHKMTTGESLLIPSESSLSWVPSLSPVTLCCQEQYEYELGFDEMGARVDHVIRDLVPSSRAAQSGLRNGDRLIGGFQLNDTELDYDRNLTAEVERSGISSTFNVDFWPHSYQSVKSCLYEFPSPHAEL
ncbi:hypothetical protein N7493_006756 [Penicillium malachiteum]|uniref:Peptidase M61 catalytic domain-containing protein n=1 Tax=Penicillium malachiteum TaxID=1324776 RepID=A0AAD6HK34_9EURO|nr:hypothetical protein N7493_006756 [Penicillium malachiteum]